ETGCIDGARLLVHECRPKAQASILGAYPAGSPMDQRLLHQSLFRHCPIHRTVSLSSNECLVLAGFRILPTSRSGVNRHWLPLLRENFLLRIALDACVLTPLMLAALEARDGAAMHLVGTVGQTHDPGVGVELGQAKVLGNAPTTVRLDGQI